MSTLTCADVLAGRAPKDAPVTVRGWVRTRRDSKAGISFVHVSDGSAFHPVQLVVPSSLSNFSEIQKLTTGCAVEGTDHYPIQPKPHTMEFLREVAHLRPRTNVIGATTRVRHTVAKAIHRFF